MKKQNISSMPTFGKIFENGIANCESAYYNREKYSMRKGKTYDST